MERKHQESQIELPEIVQSDHNSKPVKETTTQESQSKLGSLLKRAVVTTGKGVIKGIKKIADSTRKSIQIRHWNDDILQRMSVNELKRLYFEKRVSTKKSKLKESRSGDFYWKEYDCSKTDLISRLKNRVMLKDIISFAKRNHVNIREILIDINLKKQQWRIWYFFNVIWSSSLQITKL